jgi:copper chaperone
MAGVANAKVLFNSSKVKAEFDEKTTSADAISATIQKLGYSIQTVKIS